MNSLRNRSGGVRRRGWSAFVLCAVSGLSQVLAQDAAPVAKPVDAKATAAAMAAGIEWLLRHQDDTGGWSASLFVRHDPKGDLCTGTGKPDQDLHVTAWATFALLARGNTETRGPHRRAVVKAFAWLQKQMQADGFVGAPEAGNAVVAHAMCCCVLVEGKGLGGAAPDKLMFEKLSALRLPDGTWPEKIGDPKGDPTATYWASLASVIGAAYGGTKCDLEPALSAIEKGELAAPMPPAAEMVMRWLARHSPASDARLVDLVDVLGNQLPQWREGRDGTGMNFVDWQQGTQGLFQAGGEAWNAWYPALQTALVPHQRTDGAHAGSWDPIDANGKQCGRIYATAVNVVSLSLGHRLGRGGDTQKK